MLPPKDPWLFESSVLIDNDPLSSTTLSDISRLEKNDVYLGGMPSKPMSGDNEQLQIAIAIIIIIFKLGIVKPIFTGYPKKCG